MKTHKWILEGLDCAHCASKIEHAVSTLQDVNNVELNFMQKTLCFATHDAKLPEIRKVISQIEPDVTIKTNSDNERESLPKTAISRIIVSAIMFVCAFFLPFKAFVLLAAYIIVGADVLLRAFKNIVRGNVFDENFLMSVATIGAIAIGEFHEAVGVMLFYQIGELFQTLAVNRSRRSIRSLIDIRPDFANLKCADGTMRVSPEDVKIDDIIVINPGERIALDAIVEHGSSQVDTSAITGESVSRNVKPGDTLISGCVNLTGVLQARVTQVFEKSTASRVLELVEHATAKKSRPENFITKFARIYTPAVIASTLALALIPPAFGAPFKDWLYRALMFLVISCPCALVVSVPLSFFMGIGRASKNGILVKGSNYLDALARIKTVVFDKTGTLTQGAFSVQEIVSENPDLLEIVALCESASPHPIAESIRAAYAKTLDISRVKNICELPGRGVSASVDGKSIFVGNAALLDENGIPHPQPALNGVIVFAAINGVYAGYIRISDVIKRDANDAIRALRNLGIKNIVMLSGDSPENAESCAQALGIDSVYSELLPADKLYHLETLLADGTLAFVGDGINDAPSLARADIGIAMGALGTDAAIESADVVLMNDDLSTFPKAIEISRKTRSVVMQNIVFTLAVKAVFLLLGALGIATMWTAVFADVGILVIAILNAMRAM